LEQEGNGGRSGLLIPESVPLALGYNVECLFLDFLSSIVVFLNIGLNTNHSVAPEQCNTLFSHKGASSESKEASPCFSQTFKVEGFQELMLID